MTSSVKENEAEMINLSTTGDERTVDHEAKLKLSIQEIACLAEDDTGNIAGDVKVMMVLIFLILIFVMMTEIQTNIVYQHHHII